jgi:hypothetical protein
MSAINIKSPTFRNSSFPSAYPVGRFFLSPQSTALFPDPDLPMSGGGAPPLPSPTGGGPSAPVLSDPEVQGPPLVGAATGGGNPIAPPSPIRPVFADPKIKALNDREESEHQLLLERHRRRQEADALAALKAKARQEGESAARARNLAASEAAKAEGRKKRPQNFNPDGTPKSPQQRVATGTANDTDKLMALEGESRDIAFAQERAKSKVQNDVAQTAYQSALDRLNVDYRMRKLGLNPSNAADRARFQDLLRLATH